MGTPTLCSGNCGPVRGNIPHIQPGEPTFPIGTYYGPAPISNAVVSPCTYLRQLGAMNKNNLVVGGVIGNRGNAGSGIFPRYRLRFPKNGFLTCGNFYFFYGFGV